MLKILIPFLFLFQTPNAEITNTSVPTLAPQSVPTFMPTEGFYLTGKNGCTPALTSLGEDGLHDDVSAGDTVERNHLEGYFSGCSKEELSITVFEKGEGNLPDGLHFYPDSNTITGSLQKEGTTTLTIRATGTSGKSVEMHYTIFVETDAEEPIFREYIKEFVVAASVALLCGGGIAIKCYYNKRKNDSEGDKSGTSVSCGCSSCKKHFRTSFSGANDSCCLISTINFWWNTRGKGEMTRELKLFCCCKRGESIEVATIELNLPNRPTAMVGI